MSEYEQLIYLYISIGSSFLLLCSEFLAWSKCAANGITQLHRLFYTPIVVADEVQNLIRDTESFIHERSSSLPEVEEEVKK